MRIFLLILLILIIGFAGWFWLLGDDAIDQVAVNTRTPTPSGIISSPAITTTAISTASPATRSPVITTATPTPGTGGGEDINFIRRGTILRDATGADTWYLSYSIGSSTYRAKLLFPPDSACLIQGSTQLCSAVTLTPGTMARIQGFFENNTVEVITLEVLSAGINPTPTTQPSPTTSPTISPSPTLSPTISPSPITSPSPTISPTMSPTISPANSPSPTLSLSPSPSISPTVSPF